MKKIKNIFIAGHNGLLGSSILEEFIKDKNYNVLIKTRKELDLLNFNKVNNFFKKNKINLVINAAGLVGGIKKNLENQINFLEVNFYLQSNLIKASFQNKVSEYINIASSCIYPSKSIQPLKEEYLMRGLLEKTNEGYALAKICGIKLCEFYSEKYNFLTKTVIPCNIYGINDKYFNESSHFLSGIISKIYLAKINNKKNVKLWGTGKPKRELILNTDAAKAIKFCIDKNLKEKKINIGSGFDYSIKQYADKIKKKLNYNGVILWDTNYPDGIKKKLLDVRILKKYKYSNQYNFDEGLELVIKKFLDKYQ